MTDADRLYELGRERREANLKKAREKKEREASKNGLKQLSIGNIEEIDFKMFERIQFALSIQTYGKMTKKDTFLILLEDAFLKYVKGKDLKPKPLPPINDEIVELPDEDDKPWISKL